MLETEVELKTTATLTVNIFRRDGYLTEQFLADQIIFICNKITSTLI